MKDISCLKITNTVATLFRDACTYLPDDVIDSIKQSLRREKSPLGKHVLKTILSNIKIAEQENMPLCQDTGTAIIFLELGQDAHITGGNLNDAVQKGVRKGYIEGYLRKSIVSRPFSARVNTGDNTPAIIHTDIVKGDRLKIIALPKGGGAENCSRLTMLNPSQGRNGIIEFVIKLVDDCGANACPPLIVGIGIGGSPEKTALLAKRALLRKVGSFNSDREIARLEREILNRINKLGIGPMGYGGKVTAMAVNIEAHPTHIASLPVAVNLQCWCSRHKEAIL